jgi:hypothetical protein
MFNEPEANAAELTAMTGAGATGIWTGPAGGAPPLEMAGGTTFQFVTGGITDALARAQAAAGGRGVAIAGGAATVKQYLAAGAGPRRKALFEGVGRTDLRQVEVRPTGWSPTCATPSRGDNADGPSTGPAEGPVTSLAVTGRPDWKFSLMLGVSKVRLWPVRGSRKVSLANTSSRRSPMESSSLSMDLEATVSNEALSPRSSEAVREVTGTVNRASSSNESSAHILAVNGSPGASMIDWASRRL